LKRMLFLVTFLLLYGCQGSNPKSYSDFPHINHWDDLHSMTSEVTILYLYSPTCQLCQSIEEPVLELFDDLQAHVAVYLVHSGLIYGQGEPPVDVESVPSLIVLEYGEFRELIRGPNHVVDFLEATKAAYQN